ncbi:MAG: translation initiation factor IF-2 [Oscillospiraceae bacterium]|nr:translation initiation factor IF-2 [Oscillospiraceae bacterium]
MTKKVKLNDLAKELSQGNQELINSLEQLTGAKKKPASGLDSEEVNLLLEYYSQNNEVESFDAYFASKNKPVIKQEEPKAEEKPKRAAKKTEKAPKQEAKKADQAQKPTKSDKTEKVEKSQQTAEISEPVKEAVKTESTAAPKTEEKSEDKKANQKQNKKAQKAPAKAQDRGVRQQLSSNFSSTSSNESTVKRTTVDTRGSYVDLDKYNERYEKIAPQGGKNKDNYSKKQKITQKSQQRKNQHMSSKRETEAEKLQRLALERARKQQLKVTIPDEIVVSDLAQRLKVTATEVIKKLMGLGVFASINQVIDFDTAALVAEELGAKVEKEVVITIEERLINNEDDDDGVLVERSPVVVVMGHVDHGKTSLLDRIRNSNVTASEAGGITQHIGAYRVSVDGREVTFLDTPGHEAFTSMRARGASITDIAILVVAADDGIMPQTVEAINHAKAANVQIIVAINKIDKEGANPDRVKQELTEHGLVIEEWGGDIICVPVSAKTGEGFDELLENVVLVADVMELKANPDRLAKGTVIEARLDKGRGPVATVLVQNGTLKSGDIVIAGTAEGRIRVMTDDKGRRVKTAGPSVPVEITGLAEVPSAGDIFNAVEDEKLARELVNQRKEEAKQEVFKQYQKVTLDNLFSRIEQGEIKELPIIVKADVQGSVEAVKQSLEKLTNDEVRVRVIHGGVGAVSESDVMLANASNAIIVGFNVRPDPIAMENARRDGVDIRLYRIIYDAIEEISTAMKGMLAPKFREVQMGRIEVRQVYKISSVGMIAGGYVLDGKITRACQIRVVRDGIVLAEDKIDSLKRFKDDVKEVNQGYECGVGLEKYNDIKEGDIFEAFIIEEYRED